MAPSSRLAILVVSSVRLSQDGTTSQDGWDIVPGEMGQMTRPKDGAGHDDSSVDGAISYGAETTPTTPPSPPGRGRTPASVLPLSVVCALTDSWCVPWLCLLGNDSREGFSPLAAPTPPTFVTEFDTGTARKQVPCGYTGCRPGSRRSGQSIPNAPARYVSSVDHRNANDDLGWGGGCFVWAVYFRLAGEAAYPPDSARIGGSSEGWWL